MEKNSFTDVLFDLDGTLVDSAPGIMAGFSIALSLHGVVPACELSKAVIGPPLDETLRTISGISDAAMLEDLAASFRAYYDEKGYQKTLLFEGVDDMLLSLLDRGYNLHITTNKRLKPTMLILDYFGWKKIFSSVCALDSIQPRYKNKTEMLSNQLIQQGIAPKNAVYVGDSEGDRIAAQENSLYFIRADWGYEMENSRLDPA